MKYSLCALVLLFLVGCSAPSKPSPTPTQSASASPTADANTQNSSVVGWKKDQFGFEAIVSASAKGDIAVDLEMEDDVHFEFSLMRYVEQGGARVGGGIGSFRSIQPNNIEEQLREVLSENPEFAKHVSKVLAAYLESKDPRHKPAPEQAELARKLLSVSKE